MAPAFVEAVIMLVELVERVSPASALVVVPLFMVMLPPVEASFTPFISVKLAFAVIASAPPVVKFKEVGVPPMFS